MGTASTGKAPSATTLRPSSRGSSVLLASSREGPPSRGSSVLPVSSREGASYVVEKSSADTDVTLRGAVSAGSLAPVTNVVSPVGSTASVANGVTLQGSVSAGSLAPLTNGVNPAIATTAQRVGGGYKVGGSPTRPHSATALRLHTAIRKGANHAAATEGRGAR